MGLFDKIKKKNSQHKVPASIIPGVGRMPFPAYRGNKPYIFISYAHLDAEIVFREIKSFNEYGYNVWYDEGISPGNEWTDEIAIALESSSLFIVMITPNSAVSPNVLKEVNFAINDNKPVVAIHLVETKLQGGLKLQISSIQAILKYKMSEEEYVYKYTTAFKRLGMKSSGKIQQENILSLDAETAENKMQINETIPAGYFKIDHGMLREYTGKEPNITLPDEVEIISNSSFGSGRIFIETVDLNKTGALLNNAFTDCPNLRKVFIPRTVTMIEEKPFVNCPKLTVYCYRDHIKAGFADNFGGKAIIYMDDDPECIEKEKWLKTDTRGDGERIFSGQTAGLPENDKVYFKSIEMHKIICAELGCSEDTVLTKDMCNQVTSISVCGNAVGKKFNAYTNDGVNVSIVPITKSGDTMRLVGRGSLDSLEDIPLLHNLTKLILPYQSIYDLTPLTGSKIEKLDISNNVIDDISPLASLRYLKDLQLNHIQTDSISSLGKSRSLNQLVFSGISQKQFDELCESGNESLTSIIVSSSRKLENIENIGKLINIESLYIGDSRVTNIEPAVELRYLKRFGIMYLEIPELSVIKKFTGLKTLSTDKKQEEIIAELFGGTFPFRAY